MAEWAELTCRHGGNFVVGLNVGLNDFRPWRIDKLMAQINQVCSRGSKLAMLRSLATFVLTTLVLTTLVSCKSTLEVEGEFPRPVIYQLPLTLGVLYKQQFKNYRYVETDEDRSQWEIGIGNAQLQLFDTVLPAMFKKLIPVSDLKSPHSESIDLFFEPTVEEFQYNVPTETKVKMFEVWIKYNMKVYDAQGQLIADWILTAYGKTPSAFMKSEESALNEAMIIALRDVGAGLSLKFSHVPEINAWLAQRNTANPAR